MSLLSAIRTGAGLVSISLFLILALFFGRFALNWFVLPVPTWQFNLQALAFNSSAGPASSPSDQGAAIVIDKLHIQAPIATDVSDTNKAQYDAALEKGVALAQGSAALNAPSGNSFIFGHSSRFALTSTPYDQIFASIPRLEPGDTFQVISAGQKSTYQVEVSQAIAADDRSFLKSNQARQVTLITCWPLWTDWKRWVVQAVKIN